MSTPAAIGRALAQSTIVAGALLLAGCAAQLATSARQAGAEAPRQPQMQAGAHWQAISAHLEQQLGPALKASPNLPLYVTPAQDTAFTQTVTSQLITSLVNDGYVVGKKAAGALKVDIDTQVVAFSGERPQYQGQRAALGDGAWAISGADGAAPAGGHAPAQDAYTWFHTGFAAGATPKTEIVVTISVSDERRYYARSTAVYYVTDSDRSLYETVVPKQTRDMQTMKTYTVRGGQP